MYLLECPSQGFSWLHIIYDSAKVVMWISTVFFVTPGSPATTARSGLCQARRRAACSYSQGLCVQLHLGSGWQLGTHVSCCLWFICAVHIPPPSDSSNRHAGLWFLRGRGWPGLPNADMERDCSGIQIWEIKALLPDARANAGHCSVLIPTWGKETNRKHFWNTSSHPVENWEVEAQYFLCSSLVQFMTKH